MMEVTLAELITMCSLASVPNPDHIHDTLHRVVMAHSGGVSLTVLDANTATTYTPPGLEQAVAVVNGLEASSRRVNVGLAGLSGHLRARLGVGARDALDPCRNVALASLELERVLTPKTRRDLDALHRALAAYFDPDNPTELQAIDWGSRVLLVPHVSVRAQVDAPPGARAPTVTFTLSGSAIFPAGGAPGPLSVPPPPAEPPPPPTTPPPAPAGPPVDPAPRRE
jgi:hypothetical protein